MFKRKESLNFYSLLIKQAEVIRDAVAALCAYCQEPTKERGDFVKVKEKEADAVRRELVEDINRTFITPIDRDDLYRSPPPSTIWRTTPGLPLRNCAFMRSSRTIT